MNKKDCIYRWFKIEGHAKINGCHALPSGFLNWDYISYRVHRCGLLVGSVMGGCSARHTWAVITKYTDEKKRSSFFIESMGIGWVKNWIKLVKMYYLYPKVICHAHSTLTQRKWNWIKCTHLVSQWLENMTSLQMWPILDASSLCYEEHYSMGRGWHISGVEWRWLPFIWRWAFGRGWVVVQRGLLIGQDFLFPQ